MMAEMKEVESRVDSRRPVDAELVRACEIALVHLDQRVAAAPVYRPLSAPTAPPAEPRSVGATVLRVVVALTVAVSVAVPATVLAARKAHASASSCPPVAYAIAGAGIPALAVGKAEAHAAFDEIGRLSGLRFVEATTGVAPAVVVRWTAPGSLGVRHDGVARVGRADYRRSVHTSRPVVAGVIRIDRDLLAAPDRAPDPRLRAVLLHEIGHVLDLAHSPEPTSVMHGVVNPGAAWTSSDLAQLHDTGVRAGCFRPARRGSG